jgi:hypothetical protein
MKIKQHKESGLWVADDGRVIMPPCPNIHRFKHTWTYGCKNKKGYLRVKFRGKNYSVHRLIAGAFLDNPLNLPTIDHKNRIRDDNRADNLRYASPKMQADNKQSVDGSLERYGVRRCEDINGYHRAFYAKNPEFAERQRTRKRALLANNPEFAERERARCRKYRAKQKALGKHDRKCPDGSHKYLTDAEFNELYKEKLK